MKSTCPLCELAADAERLGNYTRYDCSSGYSFEITDAEEAIVRNPANADRARAHRERMEKERNGIRGTTIHRVGF